VSKREGRICTRWDEGACRVEDVRLERLRDFFRVTGKATNLLECALPHLMLKLEVLDAKGRQVVEDIFHITDRRLDPEETALFKLEGEWKKGMAAVRVTVEPRQPKGQ
jgi:hypothetical protein